MVGQINIDPAKPHAFLSYTRSDDEFFNGGISALRIALEKAVKARTGASFRIFQDVDDIKPGDIWRQKLDKAIEAAQLFIPILTPSFFTSAFCRREAKAFLDYEARAGRGDLVLPIYLIDSDLLNNERLRNADDIARQLHDRQYSDWRELGFQLQAEESRPHIFELAGAIATAIARTNDVAEGPALPTTNVEEELSALKAQLEERDEAIEAVYARNERLEAEIAQREKETRELAEEKAVFQRRAEDVVRAQLHSEPSADLKERLTTLEQAFTKERTKTRRLSKELAASEEKVDQIANERSTFESKAEKVQALDKHVHRLERELEDRENEVERLSAELVAVGRDRDEPHIERDRAIEAARREYYRQADSHKAVGLSQSWFDRLKEGDGGLTWPNAVKLPKQKMVVALFGVSILAGGTWLYSNSITTFEAGTVFRDCDECPEMVVIPAGEFLMGSPDGEGDDDEHPQHKVTISDPFALGRYEVTFAEWDACVAAGGCDYKLADLGRSDGIRPVAHVNWQDAKQYVDWLSRKTQEEYHLPSEAQWEYAARAGTETAYFWGDELGRNQANCQTCGSRWDGKKTAPAGSFEPNSFGLHDMHGNVWEWIQDTWHPNYLGAPADGRSWEGSDTVRRVRRGGSFGSNRDNIRSPNRLWNAVEQRILHIGFRVARKL